MSADTNRTRPIFLDGVRHASSPRINWRDAEASSPFGILCTEPTRAATASANASAIASTAGDAADNLRRATCIIVVLAGPLAAPTVTAALASAAASGAPLRERPHAISLSKFEVSHSLLVFRFKVAVQCHMLVDRQRFPPGVAGDELQLGVRKA